jgi:hypothetical protein
VKPIDSWWWGESAAARALAGAIYDDRAFDRLPILADALEGAGCDKEPLLSYQR